MTSCTWNSIQWVGAFAIMTMAELREAKNIDLTSKKSGGHYKYELWISELFGGSRRQPNDEKRHSGSAGITRIFCQTKNLTPCLMGSHPMVRALVHPTHILSLMFSIEIGFSRITKISIAPWRSLSLCGKPIDKKIFDFWVARYDAPRSSFCIHKYVHIYVCQRSLSTVCLHTNTYWISFQCSNLHAPDTSLRV